MTPGLTLIKKGRIKMIGHGNGRVFWELGVGDNKVKIIERKERSGDFYDCTCKNCTIFGPEAGICTFKAALIAYKVLGVKKK